MPPLNGVPQPEAGLPQATTGVGFFRVLGPTGASIKVKAPFISLEDYGAVGDGVTNDLAAITAALAASREENLPVRGPKTYFTNGPIIIQTPDDEEYWDGSTDIRPLSYYINRIKTSSLDAAVKIYGSLISDSVRIGHIIGPGYSTLGTPGGTDERIGVLIEGPMDIQLGSATDFNFGVVMQNCFSTQADIGFTLACKKGFYARVKPGDANGTNQRNNIRIRKSGGPYTSEAFPDDTLRRARGCDVGVHLASMSGSFLDLGSPEYCQQGSTSTGVLIDAAVTKNVIYAYLEGARDDGELLNSAGLNNEIHLSGLLSPSNVKTAAIRITGIGNDIYGLGDVIGASSQAGFTPAGSAGVVQIAPGNTIHGRLKQQVTKAPSTLRMNLLTDATTFTASSGSLTVTTSTSDVPAGYDFKESYEFSVPDNSTYWYTSGNITVTGEARDTVRVRTAVRGITSHPKIAFYLMSSAGTLLDGNQSVTADPSDPDWTIIEYLAKIGTSLTNIWFRFSIRNVSPGETGGVLRACRPLISYNLSGDMVRSNDVMPSDKSVWGFIPKNMINKQGFSYEPQVLTDIPGTNVFDVNNRAMAVCTGHATSSTVNLINSMIDNQPVMILNRSGSDITFTTSALNGAAVVLASGEGFSVVRFTGDSKATRVG